MPDSMNDAGTQQSHPYAMLMLAGILVSLLLQIARGTYDILRDDKMNSLQQENQRLREEKHTRGIMERSGKK